MLISKKIKQLIQKQTNDHIKKITIKKYSLNFLKIKKRPKKNNKHQHQKGKTIGIKYTY
jgi:hypothetical protein